MKKLVLACLVIAMVLTCVMCGKDELGENSQSETNSGSEMESGSEAESESGSELESSTEAETGSEGETGSETEGDSESETESETGTEGSTEEQTPDENGYTYTALDKTMWTSDVLNVRDKPSTEGTKIGQLVFAAEVRVTGQCNETDWYRVEYNDGVGYVSNKYLVDEKPATQEPVISDKNLTVDLLLDVTGKKPKKVGSIYVIGNAAFEAYGYNESRAQTYAELITKVADSLKGVSNVYCMPIPLGSGVLLPDEYKSQVSAGDQGAAIDSVLGYMGTNVIPVDIHGSLVEHRNEYLYFRTDHHWTQLGAYYAYVQFCEKKGITAHTLDEYEQRAYGGFVGSFYFSYYENYKSTVNALYNAPDIVYTYNPISNAKMTVTDSNGKSYAWPIIKDVSNYKKGVKYSCFIAGDNPYTVIENKDITDGTSCVIVKESYGNAFVPYLVDHYQTVYVIDQRYWKGNVIDFAKENGVTDVIFANNLTAIGSKGQIANFKKIIE